MAGVNRKHLKPTAPYKFFVQSKKLLLRKGDKAPQLLSSANLLLVIQLCMLVTCSFGLIYAIIRKKTRFWAEQNLTQ